jgi:uncharacterized protein DUF1064
MKYSLTKAPALTHMSEAVKKLNPHLCGGKVNMPMCADTQPLAPKRTQAHGLSPLRGRKQMNKTESAFALRLEAMKSRGDIRRADWEGVTLRLPDGMSYTADFFVTANDGRLILIEVKGAWLEDDAVVKFRAFRAYFTQLTFQFWQCKCGEWRQLL